MDGQSPGISASRSVRSALGARVGSVDHRYLVLSAVIIVALTVQTLNQQWSTDVWLHVSVVRELKTHVSDPGSPLILGTETHPDFSPYTVAVGVLAKIGGLSALSALSIAALGNLLLFLIAFYLAVSALTGRPRAAFWALIFTQLLWGIIPWRWSGYMNANSIGFGLPYPSMFATGLALLGFAAMVRLCRQPDLRIALGLTACIVVVALTHPITGFALILGLLAIALSTKGVRSNRTAFILGALGSFAAVLVLTWPYYSFVELLQQSERYDGSHLVLYDSVPQRAFLGLGSLLFLWPAFRRDRRDPLVLMAIGAAGTYVIGYVSGTETLGRIFPLLLFSGHVSAACWITDTVDKGTIRSLRPRRVVIVLGTALTIGALGVSPAFARMVPRAMLPPSLQDNAKLGSVQQRFDFLEPIAQYDVVLVDDTVGAMVVPALSGKVVLPGYPTPFIDDIDQRARDVQTMLSDEEPGLTRELLARYNVDFILLTADDVRKRGLLDYGEVIYEDTDYTLIRLPDG